MTQKQKAWQDFINLVKQASNEGRLEMVFEVFLTQAEREDLAKRYEIIRSLLLTEKPQRQIAQELGLSISKVTRGANEIKRTPSKVKTFLEDALSEPSHQKKKIHHEQNKQKENC